jgi:hypothetical protein
VWLTDGADREISWIEDLGMSTGPSLRLARESGGVADDRRREGADRRERRIKE